MVVLPAQLAFQKGTEGQIGVLEKTDTDKPEFVIDTKEVPSHKFAICEILVITNILDLSNP